jgi:hypothetical protein
MKKTKSVNIFWTACLFSKNTETAVDLLVAEESMAGLGSAAATATATTKEKGDEDMAPSDMNNDYKVHTFQHLHSSFGYNSLGSTCTCHYLIVGSNVFHNRSSSKLNFWFVGSPIVPHWEGHNSSIRSAIEVNEHLMESLFDKLSNRSDPISISRRQGLQITNIFCRYFWR